MYEYPFHGPLQSHQQRMGSLQIVGLGNMSIMNLLQNSGPVECGRGPVTMITVYFCLLQPFLIQNVYCNCLVLAFTITLCMWSHVYMIRCFKGYRETSGHFKVTCTSCVYSGIRYDSTYNTGITASSLFTKLASGTVALDYKFLDVFT